MAGALPGGVCLAKLEKAGFRSGAIGEATGYSTSRFTEARLMGAVKPA